MVIALGLSPTATAEQPPVDTPNNNEVRVGATLKDSTLIGYVDETPMSVNLFDPVDTWNCEVVHNPDHVIVTLETYELGTPSGGFLWPGGDLDLACGTEGTHGWWHIKARHEASTAAHPWSWNTIRDRAASLVEDGTPIPHWDDFMWDAVESSVTFPRSATSGGNQKVCFSTEYSLWVGSAPVETYWVNTIAARDNLRVITAYLSDNQNIGSDCSD